MLNRRSGLSPLIIFPPRVPNAICSFGFFVQEKDTLREQHVANAHSASLAREFILRWRDRGGQVLDLRPQGQRLEQQPDSPSRAPLRLRALRVPQAQPA